MFQISSSSLLLDKTAPLLFKKTEAGDIQGGKEISEPFL